MATHSNILAWESPQTEEPSWLQSMVSQRVGRDSSNVTEESSWQWGASGWQKEKLVSWISQETHNNVSYNEEYDVLQENLILRFFLIRLLLDLPLLFTFLNIYLSTWLCQVLLAACGIFRCDMWDLVPRPGIKPWPPELEHRVLATGPPGNHWIFPL